MKPFESFMAKELQQYVAYRKQLGYAKKQRRKALFAFDCYLKQQNADWDQLNPAFFLQLRATISNHPNTVNQTLSAIRGFFQYLVRQGICGQNPVMDIPPLAKRYYIPFVFSRQQTDQLLQALCENIRQTPKYFLMDMAIYLAIVLLARCGMRISEPLRLQHHHYRSDEGSLYIEKTKFRKDRLIPVPQSVLPQIENYLALRKALCADDKNPYLLAARKQIALRDDQIRLAFHQGVKNIGLSRAKHTIGDLTFGAPVPHSLRHSFAINTLTQIKARGHNPQHALPVLAAYMGHCKYQYTGAYLKVNHARDRSGLIEFAKSQLDVI